MTIDTLPPINATLNGISATLLVTAYIFVKRRSYRIHASLTISAFLVSTVFLCLYLYHKHLLMQATGSPNTSTANVHPAILRHLYLFLLLLPHLVLAIVMVPMILLTFYFAATRRWTAHRKLAPPTFYIWLYVSITGVLVYLTLYHLFPHFRTPT
jgi:putative membrane protein